MDASQCGEEAFVMERTGFVLEGGGMRGIYTAGVLDELMDWGLGFWAYQRARSTGRASSPVSRGETFATPRNIAATGVS